MIEPVANNTNYQLARKLLDASVMRQEAIANNIANVDTPGYVARDYKFGEALQQATQGNDSPRQLARPSGMNAKHIALSATTSSQNGGLGYSVASQPSLDGNSVDLDRERAAFADNSIRYESTLRFINGHVKTMLSAIQGQ